jgi:MoaA/NifB/PqqE/SkfB family radical SAM enzyme
MGEPLLHPQFFSILEYARALKLRIGLTTNGALLRPDTLENLAEQDLHQIDISVQTPDEGSFQATRGSKVDFHKYQKGLLDLLAACQARPNPPIFKIRMMTTRFAGKMRSHLGIPDFMGSNEALRQTVLEWTEAVYNRLGFDAEKLRRLRGRVKKIRIHGWNVIEIAPKIFIETYVLTDWGNAFMNVGIIEANHGYCFGMRDHFAILYTGDVVLCCVDFDGKTALGNLTNSPLIDILRDRELEIIMEGFRHHRLAHPHCRRCLGSRSRVGSWFKPAMSILGLKVLKPFFYRQYRLFD